MIKSVFFDVGGTLCRASAECNGEGQSFMRVLSIATNRNIEDLEMDVRQLIWTSNVPKDLIIKKVCEHLGIMDWKSVYSRIKAHHFEIILYKDVIPCLRELQNYKIGILSNASIWTALDHKDLGLAQFVECSILSCYVGVAKPFIEIFDRARQVSGLEARELAYVGNSLKDDIFPALNAGWKAVLLDRSRKAIKSPVPIIPELSVLPGIIASL